MSKNIGFSQRHAKLLAKTCNTSDVESYSKKSIIPMVYADGIGRYHWIVILQKRNKKFKAKGDL